jgi:hypothetical protein
LFWWFVFFALFFCEDTGVSRRLIRRSDFVVEFPPLGPIDTLNVGNAVSAFFGVIHLLQNMQNDILLSNNPIPEPIPQRETNEKRSAQIIK